MQAQDQGLHLTVEIECGAEIDDEELDEYTHGLRSELVEMGVSSAELLGGEPVPEGAKSAEAVTIGSLALVVLPTFLPKLIEYLQAWTQRAENRRVKIKTQVGDHTIELDYLPSAMSTQELKRLVKTLSGALGKANK